MLSYFSTSPVSAARIIAIQRAGGLTNSPATLICEAADVSNTAALLVSVAGGWMTANSPAVGGYLVTAGAVQTYIPATAFVALYPPVFNNCTVSTAQGSKVSAAGTVV